MFKLEVKELGLLIKVILKLEGVQINMELRDDLKIYFE